MDNPHPLETLGDSGAYGPDGSISRYHNPDSYTRVRAGRPWNGHRSAAHDPVSHSTLCLYC